MKHPKSLATALLVLLACGSARADFIAYEVTPGLVGNQSYSGSLGLDFRVGSDAIAITSLGVFDSGGDGLASSKIVYIYDRDSASIVSGSMTTIDAGGGDLVGGSRFVSIAPVTLAANGRYSIVAQGFSEADLNFNSTFTPGGAPSVLNTGGLISFEGSRYGLANEFPTIDTLTESNVFAAGTFTGMIASVGPPLAVPEPGSIALFSIGAIGLAGRLWVLRKRASA